MQECSTPSHTIPPSATQRGNTYPKHCTRGHARSKTAAQGATALENRKTLPSESQSREGLARHLELTKEPPNACP